MNELDPRYIELYNNADPYLQERIREEVYDTNIEYLGGGRYQELVVSTDDIDIEEQTIMLLSYLEETPQAKEILALMSLNEIDHELLRLNQLNNAQLYRGDNSIILDTEVLDLIDFAKQFNTEELSPMILTAQNLSDKDNPKPTIELMYDAYIYNAVNNVRDVSLQNGEIQNMLSEEERTNQTSNVSEISDHVLTIFRGLDDVSRTEVILELMEKQKSGGEPLSAEQIAGMVVNKSLESMSPSENFKNSGDISFEKLQEMQRNNGKL